MEILSCLPCSPLSIPVRSVAADFDMPFLLARSALRHLEEVFGVNVFRVNGSFRVKVSRCCWPELQRKISVYWRKTHGEHHEGY